MTKDFIHYSTYFEVRCPIADNGAIGQPEIVKKFTNSWLASKSSTIKKKKVAPKSITLSSEQESMEM